MKGLRAAMDKLEQTYDFRGHKERRGDYVSTNYGASFGGGQKVRV